MERCMFHRYQLPPIKRRLELGWKTFKLSLPAWASLHGKLERYLFFLLLLASLPSCGHGHRSNTLAAAGSGLALVSNGVRDEWAIREQVGRSSGGKSCHQTKLMEGVWRWDCFIYQGVGMGDPRNLLRNGLKNAKKLKENIILHVTHPRCSAQTFQKWLQRDQRSLLFRVAKTELKAPCRSELFNKFWVSESTLWGV